MRRVVATGAVASVFVISGGHSAHGQTSGIFVSPSGNDGRAGSQSAPVRSIDRALQIARTTHRHRIQFQGGTYVLTAPIALNSRDSGMTLTAAANAHVVISGGRRIMGWHVVDGKANLWSSPLPTGIPAPRQIYINGVRATRTRGRIPVELTKNDKGYTAAGDVLAHWRHSENMEFVYTGGNALWSEPSVGLGSWTEPRCPVAAIHGTEIEIAEPCWTNSTSRAMLPSGIRSANLVGPVSVGKQPSYLENAYELLGTPGQFYLDTSSRMLFYTPRKGEDLHTADVEVPVLETLLKIEGTEVEPVHDITISGLTFAYAGWQEPSSPEGFSEIQANYRVTGRDGADKQALCTLVPGGTCPYAAWTPETANVFSRYADKVRFERDVFTHLGAAGLAIHDGAHQDVVEGCVFTDISGNGLELAGVDQPAAPDAEFAVGNRIENNLFRNVGTEFHGGIPIVIGYARFTHVAHNQIDHVPYAGISIGWGGWPDKIALPGVANRSTGNVIEKNLITRFMLDLSDGGGIYTQGRTGETLVDGERVEGNVVHDQFSSGHAIYTDNGSAMITVRGNVMVNTNHDNWGSRHKDYYDGGKGDNFDPLTIEENWWQQGDPDSSRKQVTESGNHLISSFDEVPRELLAEAGLESAYRKLASRSTHVVAPEAPASVAAFTTPTDAYVTWRPPVFDGGAAVDRYRVHSDLGEEATMSAEEFDRQAYIKVPLSPKTGPRRFTVVASNSAGSSPESMPSLEVAAAVEVPPVPGAPQSVSVHLQGSRASIHFSAPKGRDPHVLAYVVSIEPGGRKLTFTGRRLLTLEGTHVTFVTVEGLTPAKQYRFGVAAIGPAGEGDTTWVQGEHDPNLSRLHMEPFGAVRDMLRDRNLRDLPDKDSIGGPPQIMKVFQYSQTASFALKWPDNDQSIRPFLNQSIRPFLNGRRCLHYEKLDILCLDRDTFEATYGRAGASRSKFNHSAVGTHASRADTLAFDAQVTPLANRDADI